MGVDIEVFWNHRLSAPDLPELAAAVQRRVQGLRLSEGMQRLVIAWGVSPPYRLATDAERAAHRERKEEGRHALLAGRYRWVAEATETLADILQAEEEFTYDGKPFTGFTSYYDLQVQLYLEVPDIRLKQHIADIFANSMASAGWYSWYAIPAWSPAHDDAVTLEHWHPATRAACEAGWAEDIRYAYAREPDWMLPYADFLRSLARRMGATELLVSNYSVLETYDPNSFDTWDDFRTHTWLQYGPPACCPREVYYAYTLARDGRKEPGLAWGQRQYFIERL